LAAAAALCACDRAPEGDTSAPARPEPVEQAEAPAREAPALADLPPANDPYTLVFLGDSLFAGFDLGEGEAVPSVVQRHFTHPQGVSTRIVNVSRNGGTAQRSVGLFDRLVPAEADAVLIQFGANDIFSGRTPQELE